jgi:hypothetical protein
LAAGFMKKLLITGLTTLLAASCEPSCEQTCEGLLACEETSTDRLALDDCTAACLVQERLYDDWEDQQLRDSFADYKHCVSEDSCESIAEGSCYDEDLYSW